MWKIVNKVDNIYKKVEQIVNENAIRRVPRRYSSPVSPGIAQFAPDRVFVHLIPYVF